MNPADQIDHQRIGLSLRSLRGCYINLTSW